MKDFKGFKKVSDSESHAVFRHENGSELKVAKSGLHPKMRKQLDSLPIYAADGVDTEPPASLKADDGGDSQDQSSVETGVPGVHISINAAPQQSAPQPQSPQPGQQLTPEQKAAGWSIDSSGGLQSPPNQSDPGLAARAGNWLKDNYLGAGGRMRAEGQQDLAPDMPTMQAGQVASMDGAIPPPPGPDQPPQAPQPSQPMAASAPMQAAPQMANTGPAQQPNEYQQAYDAYKQQHLKEFAQQDAAFDQDLRNGHITPKTYKDLFNDKGTLGKIGTIFGMMLSGAGSALAHQPNALLGMMNQQIQNDLEGQKTSKENAQNFLRINQQALMNQAQIKNLGADTAMKSYSLANMQMNRAALHALVTQAQNLPLGSPQRAQAEQTLAAMSQAVNSENYNLADTASANLSRVHMMMGDSGGGMSTAQQIRRQQILGFITPEQSNKALEELGKTQNHVVMNQNALDSFDKVAKMATLAYRSKNPLQYKDQIDAEWNPMVEKLTKDTEGRVTPITVDMMKALKPAKLTNNKDTTNIKRQKLSAILNSGFATPTLDSLGMKVDKGEAGAVPRGTQQAGNQREVRYDAQGNAYVKGPDGRPMRINQTAAK